MIIQEGIDGVSKSGEFSNRKPVDRAKNTIRQKCQSSVRGANIAQQNVLMCETHRSLLKGGNLLPAGTACFRFTTHHCGDRRWHRACGLTVTGLAKAQPHSSNPIVPPPPAVGKGRLRYPIPPIWLTPQFISS